MIRFNIISDNRETELFHGEAGLSIVIDVDDYSFLLDSCYCDLYIINAIKLGIDLDKIDTAIITHGHADHSGGVVYLPKGKTIILHPSCF